MNPINWPTNCIAKELLELNNKKSANLIKTLIDYLINRSILV